ncbi:MAG TPA: DsbA family protein [Gammaproteobacteria bacterium]|nr:DsbA family protein [Gammaproteobacteria bacterium]
MSGAVAAGAGSRPGGPELRVTVFTDYICPFCYVGDARLNRLRAEFDLKVNWCFLEIHPETPGRGRAVQELGYSQERWEQMMEALGELARAEGLVLARHDRTTNSHGALLLAEAAKDAGAALFYRVHRRLFEAYFAERRNIADGAVLRSIAESAGLASEVVERAWRESAYERRLLQYRAAARELRITATPTFFIGERRLEGVQPVTAFFEAARAAVA